VFCLRLDNHSAGLHPGNIRVAAVVVAVVVVDVMVKHLSLDNILTYHRVYTFRLSRWQSTRSSSRA
jgi:hypothetical protein